MKIKVDLSNIRDWGILSEEDKDCLKNTIIRLAFGISYLSKTKLVKLIYLSELAFYQKFGRTLTSLKFINYKHGPYNPHIEWLVEEIDGDVILQEIGKDKKGHDFTAIKPNVPETKVHLPNKMLKILDGIIKEWSKVPTNKIINFIKTTEPFISSEYEKPIDFTVLDKEREVLTSKQKKYIETTLGHYKKKIDKASIKEQLKDITISKDEAKMQKEDLNGFVPFMEESIFEEESE